jgi:arsenate reductase
MNGPGYSWHTNNPELKPEKSMKITIYHNPGCSKSRKTLELIESQGIEPRIVEYLRQPPDAQTLLRLAETLDVPLTDLLRKSEADFKGAAKSVPLDDDAALAAWLHDHPRVLQRPIVVDEDGNRAIVGRPPENVLEIIQK